MTYTPTIGLEIHAQLKTKSKMFCSCANNANADTPNSNVCPICLALPGSLPSINKKAVEMVIKTGKALKCNIAKNSKFDRKNYFYPDLPKGYQISQFDKPLCENGVLNKIRIQRIHLEEDTGKLIHKQNKSLIDFNRAGIPLMELVTEPDIKSGKQAKKFCQDLQLILRYLNVSRANMEKGEMRCEVNISLKPAESQVLGTKVEIKNLNSFKAVEQSIDYEIKRQTKLLESGLKIQQETRGWDSKTHKTVSQRSKEQAYEYRYFPEPDLPPIKPLNLADKITIPELPKQKRNRFLDQYGLYEHQVAILIKNKKLADYAEALASELGNQKLFKLAVNYLIKTKNKFRKITPENFAEFVDIVHQGKISSSAADIVLKKMSKTGADPSQIIEDANLLQVNKSKDLAPIVKTTIRQNQKAVADYHSGKKEALKFLVGKVMAATKGKANPQVSKKILIDFLAEE